MTTIDLQTKINTANSAQSLGEIKKSLKDLISLQGQVGAGSAEFTKLSNAINHTEEKLADLNDGFNTLRGSGVERLNSSLGLLREGLEGADTGKISTAFKGLGAAMSALPIFLLVEGLKILIEKSKEIAEYFGIGATESEELAKALEKQKKANEALYVVEENRIKIMQAEGVSIDKILAAEKALNDQKIQDAKNDIELQKLKIREIETNDGIVESIQRKTAAGFRFLGNTQAADIIEAGINADKLKRQKELGEFIRTDLVTISNLQTDSKIKEIEVEKKHTEYLKKINEDRAKEIENVNKFLSAKQKEIEAKAQAEDDKEQLDLATTRQKSLDELKDLALKRDQADTAEFIDNERKKEEAEKARVSAGLLIGTQAITGLQNLSNLAFTIRSANLKKGSAEEEALARKNFIINKGLQIGITLIQGIQNGISAYGAGLKAAKDIPYLAPFAPAIAAGFAAISGIGTAAAIAKISATQFGSTSGGDTTTNTGGGGSLGSGASLAPPQPQSLAFNQNTVGNIGNIGGNQANAQKVVVVSHDITRAQKNDKLIEAQATF